MHKTPIRCVYRIISKATGRYYVGATNNFKNRVRQHRQLIKDGKHYNEFLQEDMDKYGTDSFTFEIIEFVAHEDVLTIREKYWTEKLDACNRDRGYNIALAHEMNESTKQKISSTKIGTTRPPLSPEWRRRIGLSNVGKTKGRIRTLEHCRNISLHHARPQLGKPRTEDEKKNISKGRKKYWKPIIQYSLNGDLVREYESFAAMQKLTGFDYRHVADVCQGRRKTAFGYKWRHKWSRL